MSDQLQLMERVVKHAREALDAAIAGGAALTGRRVLAEGRAGAVECWVHRAEAAGASVLIDLHGGGFATGDARRSDVLHSWIARMWNVNVVGVNYRLAPENPYPAQLDDVQDVIRWLGLRGGGLDMDPARVYLHGCSAGANLALSCALRLAQAGDSPVRGIVAHYPILDLATPPALKAQRDIDLPVEYVEACNAWYVGESIVQNPEISLTFADSSHLARLPRIAILPVVGDSLFDEAVAFAGRARFAGADCNVYPVVGAYHGYIEDAANVDVYERTSIAETRLARPAGYRAVAAESLVLGLTAVLGEPCADCFEAFDYLKEVGVA